MPRLRKRRQWSPGSQTVNPLLQAWASVVDVSGLSDEVAADIDQYLRSYRYKLRYPRREMEFRLVSVVSSQVSPPPSEFINPLDVLATVLTLRERLKGRDSGRLVGHAVWLSWLAGRALSASSRSNVRAMLSAQTLPLSIRERPSSGTRAQS